RGGGAREARGARRAVAGARAEGRGRRDVRRARPRGQLRGALRARERCSPTRAGSAENSRRWIHVACPLHSARMSKTAWGGRFGEEPDARMARFGASVDVDARLAAEDVRGSIAHARMLGERGILTAEDVAKIVAGLEAI